MRLRRAWPIAGLLALSCDSGPRIGVDGLWARGGVSGDHLGRFFLLLTTDGDEITGSACYVRSDQVLFHDAPVRSGYPAVVFTIDQTSAAPCCPFYVGARFVGRVTEEQTIEGDWVP